MAKRISRNTKNTNNNRLRLGRLNVQSIPKDANAATIPTTRNRKQRTVTAITTVRDRSALAARPTRPIASSARTIVRVPFSKTVAVARIPLLAKLPMPQIKFQFPLITKPTPQNFAEDSLDISETRITNEQFVPVEKNGISPFIPEILQITDFLPIWKQNTTIKRLYQDFSAAGKLLDIQYNTLLLRRETLNNLIQNLATSKRNRTSARGTQGRNQQNINSQINSLERKINTELSRVTRTVNYYKQFISATETITTLLDLKAIPASSFDQQFLSLEDFFQRRMQYDKEQFRIFSDTKILMQLLADFKEITENYSTNLLGLTDPDRLNDNDPVLLDKSYTLNDGFTFSLDQIRSQNTPINASARSFFNAFLNSLPNESDDRIKLLTTILSKEYRVSRGLGISSNINQLREVFASGDTGSPFDNIIGIVGDNIFDEPLGPESLLSLTTIAIDQNSSVLPFERKYVDSDQTKKTYVPGSSYFVESVLEISNNSFNTTPFEEYSNQFSRKFSTARSVITELFDLNKESIISPTVMNDRILTSFRNSIENTTNVSAINRDQAIVAAVFKLANTDNELKSKLFQFCLLVGLAANSPTDLKPIFNQLANELRTINNFSEVKISTKSSPNLFGGLRTLRPYIEQLAGDIENRILALTTPTPRFSLGLTLKANPQFTRLRNRTSQKTASVSPYSRLSVSALSSNQTTINVDRFVIRRVLLANIDPRSSSISNFIKEYISIANDFSQAAAVNGEERYLLEDGSGRTRYNFLSTSTQLLILFEIVSSYIAKYSFATFIRSPSIFNALISVDAQKNEFIENVIDELIGEKSVSVVPTDLLATRIQRTIPGVVLSKTASTTTSAIQPVSAVSSLLMPTKISIKRSGDSSRSSSKTMLSSGLISRTRNNTERELIQKNLSSAFLGTQSLRRIGLNKFTPLFFQKDSINMRNTLIGIRNKITTENSIIANILNILQVVERRVREAKTRMINIYNSQTLEAFLRENTIEDLEIVRNPAQVRAAAFSIEDFTNRTKNFGKIGNENFTWFLDSEIIQPQTRTALYSLLSQNDFLIQNQADKKIKIISVGIPAGFSRQLSDRVQQSAINASTFKTKQIDVVSINIYKRDQRFDDIAFKPQSFLFDLSLFQDENRVGITEPRENERFERILERVTAQDYENIDAPRPVSFLDIVRNEKYDFLTNDQKRNIIKNHTVSSLFETYLRLLTGMRIEEESFTVRESEPGTSLDQEFINIVFAYIRNVLNISVPNKPIMEILLDPQIDETAKDMLRLFVFGDVVFEPEKLRKQITSPRLFDRVFHLPINTDLFEIDKELTLETESGKLAMEQSFVQERILSLDGRLFLKAKDRNELIFEDYFITIENVV